MYWTCKTGPVICSWYGLEDGQNLAHYMDLKRDVLMIRNGSEGRQTERTMSLLHDPYGSNTVRVNNYDGEVHSATNGIKLDIHMVRYGSEGKWTKQENLITG